MIDRYMVRRDDDNGYGVWDSRTNGWASSTDFTETSAVGVADRMNAEFVEAARRPVVRPSRRVDPPMDVLVRSGETQYPGRLDMWVREVDGWYGRATIGPDGPQSWFPATHLRPLR